MGFIGKIGAIFTIAISSFFGIFIHSPAPAPTIDTTTQTQTEVSVNPQPVQQTHTVQATQTTQVSTTPKPAPTTPKTTTPPVATVTTTTCTFTSHTGAVQTATPAQAPTPEACQSVCTNIRNEIYGQADYGVCEFKRSTGGDYIYNIQPNTASTQTSTYLTLAGSVFVTPHGTYTLKFPQNWTPVVVVDGTLGTTIITSQNPSDPSDTLSLAINARPSDYTTDSDVTSSSASVNSKGGHILATTKTANGYVMEASYQSTGRHTKLVRIETATKIYLLSESSAEGDWSAYSSFFDQAAASLQVN